MKDNGSLQLVCEHIARINRVLDYIEVHITENLTLDELASVANFSKYHFHRIFSSFTGETLFAFILRLRLEHAADMLQTAPHKTITEIAYDCGFINPSSFAKSFKKQFGCPATTWRKGADQNSIFGKTQSNIRQIISNHGKELLLSSGYTEYVNQTQVWRLTMNNKEQIVEVKNLPEMTVAYVRYVGPYKGNAKLFESLYQKIFQWAAARDLIHFPETKPINIYHDNPQITEESKLRVSICLTVPADTFVDGEIGKMTIPAGKYAVARFTLTPRDFEEAWNWVYGVWLPNSGYTCDDRPCFELYHNDDNGQERFTVDICIPVKPM